jgi:hypothetical protein
VAADLWGVTKRPRKQRISQEQMEGTFGLGLGLVWRSVILFLSLGLWRDSDKAVGDIRQEISAISKSSVLCGVRCHRGVVLHSLRLTKSISSSSLSLRTPPATFNAKRTIARHLATNVSHDVQEIKMSTHIKASAHYYTRDLPV